MRVRRCQRWPIFVLCLQIVRDPELSAVMHAHAPLRFSSDFPCRSRSEFTSSCWATVVRSDRRVGPGGAAPLAPVPAVPARAPGENVQATSSSGRAIRPDFYLKPIFFPTFPRILRVCSNGPETSGVWGTFRSLCVPSGARSSVVTRVHSSRASGTSDRTILAPFVAAALLSLP